MRLLRVMLGARLAPRTTLWDVHTTRFRVRLRDLDTLRHMTNSRYLAYADLGRVDLMLRSGFWHAAKQRGWFVVVASQTITYRRSLQPRQRFDLHTRLLGVDEASVYVEQTFAVQGAPYARAVVRGRFLTKEGTAVTHDELLGAVGPIPDHLTPPAWILDWAEHAKRLEPARQPSPDASPTSGALR